MSEQRHIIQALVAEKHRQRYAESPWFRLAVDELARFLPYLVEGLALQADEKDAARERDNAALMAKMAGPMRFDYPAGGMRYPTRGAPS